MKTNICFIILLMLSKVSLVSAQRIPLEENKLQFHSLQWLYESIQNTSHRDTVLTGWDFSDSVNFNLSSWEGITLDNEGYITKIDISGKGLKAEFDFDMQNPALPSKNRFCLVYLSKLDSVDFSNNQFVGFFPMLQYQENPYPEHQTPLYSLPKLKYLNLSNNLFDADFIVPNTSKDIIELRAANNKISSVYVNRSPYLEKIDLRNNEMEIGNFYVIWPDTSELKLDTLDVRDNKLTFASLWRTSEPIQPGIRLLFYDTAVNYLYIPQDPVPMTTIYNRKVRAQIDDTVKVELPDVGQNNQQFPEIRDSLRYQWYKEGLALANDTLVYLERLGLDSVDYGQYHCKIFYKGERLKDFFLVTETFNITGEINAAPKIKIENELDSNRYRKLRKGALSTQIQLTVTDDLPTNIEGSTFEITKWPKHLELQSGYPTFIQVKDTSHAMWVGIDTVEVTYCDFEGACINFELYFEVYGELFAPPVDTLWATQNRELILKWDTNFYDTQIKKPDGYFVLIDTVSITSEAFARFDSIPLTGMNIDSVKFFLPNKDIEYFLRIHLFGQKNGIPSVNTSITMATMPTKPDIIIQDSIIDENHIQLMWDFTNNTFPGFLVRNILYYSNDSLNFSAIGEMHQGSYTHNVVVGNRTHWYKLVKFTTFLSNTNFLVELPYLKSNIVRISTGNIILTTGFSLNKDTLSLALDSAETLLATIIPDSATNQNIRWESRNANIATVDTTGLVTAISEGETYIVVTTQDGGFKDSCLVTIEANVGIESLQLQSEDLKIYPNPTKNQLIIERGDFVIKSIEISDNKGSMQKNYSNLKNTTGNIVLDISSLSSGVYFVTIKTSVGEMVKKVIKE